MVGAAGQLGLVHPRGVGLDHGQPTLAGLRQFAEQRQEARVLLHGDHLEARFQQGAGQAAGAGAHLDHRRAFRQGAEADDLPGDV